jgi:hypothetical protein
MPGQRHKKIQPPIRKVKYVEVERKKGNFFKEVTVASSPIKMNRTPSIGPEKDWAAAEPSLEYDRPIPLYNAPTKVRLNESKGRYSNMTNLEPKRLHSGMAPTT